MIMLYAFFSVITLVFCIYTMRQEIKDSDNFRRIKYLLSSTMLSILWPVFFITIVVMQYKRCSNEKLKTKN